MVFQARESGADRASPTRDTPPLSADSTGRGVRGSTERAASEMASTVSIAIACVSRGVPGAGARSRRWAASRTARTGAPHRKGTSGRRRTARRCGQQGSVRVSDGGCPCRRCRARAPRARASCAENIIADRREHPPASCPASPPSRRAGARHIDAALAELLGSALRPGARDTLVLWVRRCASTWGSCAQPTRPCSTSRVTGPDANRDGVQPQVSDRHRLALLRPRSPWGPGRRVTDAAALSSTRQFTGRPSCS